MAYLYESFDTLTQFGAIQNKRISLIEDNLSPKLPIREYQIKAFSRFDYFYNTEFEGKQVKPYHLLYNMATGSGKTLVMAGLMLYLYEKGYRNFLFFVNSKNIIKKTKENFLNSKSFKYLFNESLFINGEKVEIKQADTFDASDERNINIKFTTIQQLYTQYSILNTQYSILNTQYSILNTQYSIHNTQYSIHNTQYSIHNTPNTQYSILNIHYSLLITNYSLLIESFVPEL